MAYTYNMAKKRLNTRFEDDEVELIIEAFRDFGMRRHPTCRTCEWYRPNTDETIKRGWCGCWKKEMGDWCEGLPPVSDLDYCNFHTELYKGKD